VHPSQKREAMSVENDEWYYGENNQRSTPPVDIGRLLRGDGFDDEKYSLDLINQSSKIASMEDSAVVVDVLIEVFYKYKFKIFT
jgi:hypothetical protein